MPKIEVSKKYLEKLIGKKLPEDQEELENTLMYSKIELDDIEGDKLKIELKDTNRPDMWCAEGVARDLKGKLNIEKGIPKYRIIDGSNEYVVYCEKTQRPYVACAIVKGVKLDQESFESLIQYQDKLSELLGRKRKEVAIGTHRLDLIKFPVYYKNFGLEEIKFHPLYGDKEMTLKEILEKHQKGQQYGKLLDTNKKLPVFIDSNNKVISFPPIINSNDIGNLTKETNDIFIDVTGYDPYYVDFALNCLVCALAELGGTIIKVKVVNEDGSERNTPDLKKVYTGINLDINYINKISGLNLSKEEIIDYLERNRLEIDEDGKIYYLNYRRDYMNKRDMVEDVIVAYDINKIEPKEITFVTKGGLNEETKLIDKLRKFFLGCGATEIRTRILTSKEILENCGIKKYLELENALYKRYEVLSPYLYPNIIYFLSRNVSREYPQIVFEIDEVVDNQGKSSLHCCFAIAHKEANVGELLSYLKTFCKEFNIDYHKIEEKNFEVFITGRSGKIENKIIFGEVHPEVLEKFELNMPVSLFEVRIKEL